MTKGCEEQFKELGERNDVLSDPQKRAPMTSRAKQLSTDGRERMRAGASHDSFEVFPRQCSGAGAFFEDLFGADAGPKPAATRRRPAATTCRSPSEEAAHGAKRRSRSQNPNAVTPVTVRVRRPVPAAKTCPTCAGDRGKLSVHAAFTSRRLAPVQGAGRVIESRANLPRDWPPRAHVEISCRIPAGVDTGSRPSIQRHWEADGVAVRRGFVCDSPRPNRMTFSSATATICCARCR